MLISGKEYASQVIMAEKNILKSSESAAEELVKEGKDGLMEKLSGKLDESKGKFEKLESKAKVAISDFFSDTGEAGQEVKSIVADKIRDGEEKFSYSAGEIHKAFSRTANTLTESGREIKVKISENVGNLRSRMNDVMEGISNTASGETQELNARSVVAEARNSKKSEDDSNEEISNKILGMSSVDDILKRLQQTESQARDSKAEISDLCSEKMAELEEISGKDNVKVAGNLVNLMGSDSKDLKEISSENAGRSEQASDSIELSVDGTGERWKEGLNEMTNNGKMKKFEEFFSEAINPSSAKPNDLIDFANTEITLENDGIHKKSFDEEHDLLGDKQDTQKPPNKELKQNNHTSSYLDDNALVNTSVTSLPKISKKSSDESESAVELNDTKKRIVHEHMGGMYMKEKEEKDVEVDELIESSESPISPSNTPQDFLGAPDFGGLQSTMMDVFGKGSGKKMQEEILGKSNMESTDNDSAKYGDSQKTVNLDISKISEADVSLDDRTNSDHKFNETNRESCEHTIDLDTDKIPIDEKGESEIKSIEEVNFQLSNYRSQAFSTSAESTPEQSVNQVTALIPPRENIVDASVNISEHANKKVDEIIGECKDSQILLEDKDFTCDGDSVSDEFNCHRARFDERAKSLDVNGGGGGVEMRDLSGKKTDISGSLIKQFEDRQRTLSLNTEENLRNQLRHLVLGVPIPVKVETKLESTENDKKPPFGVAGPGEILIETTLVSEPTPLLYPIPSVNDFENTDIPEETEFQHFDDETMQESDFAKELQDDKKVDEQMERDLNLSHGIDFTSANENKDEFKRSVEPNDTEVMHLSHKEARQTKSIREGGSKLSDEPGIIEDQNMVPKKMVIKELEQKLEVKPQSTVSANITENFEYSASSSSSFEHSPLPLLKYKYLQKTPQKPYKNAPPPVPPKKKSVEMILAEEAKTVRQRLLRESQRLHGGSGPSQEDLREEEVKFKSQTESNIKESENKEVSDLPISEHRTTHSSIAESGKVDSVMPEKIQTIEETADVIPNVIPEDTKVEKSKTDTLRSKANSEGQSARRRCSIL
ncbi:unnamed protein product [Thelazia callipaeda]|uniref:Flg_hook domain-containing protein n=1 Tax=Thelazia callipaeda TaxID=103827 RepID=A0A0N5D8F3_THECL|nr:unnamed protein product [Thelazia callipaeda]